MSSNDELLLRRFWQFKLLIQEPCVLCRATSRTDCDAAGENALDSSPVEVAKDFG